MSPKIAWTLLVITAVPNAALAANAEPLAWHDVERQIQWHRDHVRWCGPLSAIRSLRLLGHDVATNAVLDPLRDGDPRGLPVDQVLRICRAYEPHARLIRLPEKSWQRLSTPCVLIVNQGRHALVLQSLRRWRGTAEIWDPSVMQVQNVPLARLQGIWTGNAIVFQGPPWFAFALAAANVVFVVTLWRQRRRAVHSIGNRRHDR